MLAKPCGSREMHTSNWNLKHLRKLNPIRPNFKVGICVVFSKVSHVTAAQSNLRLKMPAYPQRLTDLQLDTLEQLLDISHAMPRQNLEANNG